MDLAARGLGAFIHDLIPSPPEWLSDVVFLAILGVFSLWACMWLWRELFGWEKGKPPTSQ